jgi:putative PIN family toxin of toxin-antitoxin system
MTIVLDTDVLVSGIINPNGPPGRLADLMRAGEVRLAVDDRILSEYTDVLRRPRLAPYFEKRDIDDILDYVSRSSQRHFARMFVSGLPDEKDAPFLEIAKEAGVVLVSGNLKHFPVKSRSGVTVESPSEFLQRFTDTAHGGNPESPRKTR